FDCDWSSDVCSSDLKFQTLFRKHDVGALRRVPVRESVTDEDRGCARAAQTPHDGGLARRAAVSACLSRIRRLDMPAPALEPEPRSEERRVGKEGRSQ